MSVSAFDALAGGVLELLGAGAVAWIGYLAAQALARKSAALRAQAQAYSAEHARLKQLAAAQADAINSVIAELSGSPATYATFPTEVRDRLYAAHDLARETPNRKGNS